jgi:membrane carboxypeptidase/penicillin-binding protein
MHPDLVAGFRVGYNAKHSMGAWGTGARAALPVVADVFQAALKNGWIDANARFGTQAPTLPHEWVQDRRLGLATVKKVFNEVKAQMRKLISNARAL